MEIEDVIILLLTIFIIILLLSKKNENFQTLNNELGLLGERYKLMPFPNFYQVFSQNDLSRTLEFPGDYNWKLFTDKKLIPKEGLAALISTENPPFYNFDQSIRYTGFYGTSVVIGLMTPTKLSPTGQWLIAFEWYGASNFGEDLNAKDIIVWANHKKTTDISLNSQNLIDDAIKLYEFQLPKERSLLGPKKYQIPAYRRDNHPPFTTYYFQILNNWGNKDYIKVGAIVPYFEI